MSVVVHESKLVGEAYLLNVDFLSRLNLDETLTVATAVASVWSGADDATPLTLGTIILHDQYVEIPISGGDPGVIYKIDVAGRVNATNVYVQEVRLAVLSSN